MIQWLTILWLPILVSAVGIFVASSVIHMVFKWHMSDYKKFGNEDDVRAAVRAGNRDGGMYVVPSCEPKDMNTPEMQLKMREGPVGLLLLRRPGVVPGMGAPLIQWFAFVLATSAIIGYIAYKAILAPDTFGQVAPDRRPRVPHLRHGQHPVRHLVRQAVEHGRQGHARRRRLRGDHGSRVRDVVEAVRPMADDRRYYGLDALRGGMMLLGIILHAATFYLAAPPPHVPIQADPDNSLVMDAIFDLIHSFRMPCFFVLAGFFTALLVEKRGPMGAWRNRLARIGAPLVVAILTLLPLVLLFALDFAVAVQLGKFVLIPDMADIEVLRERSAARGMPQGIPLMHLWFLLYLLYFYLLIPFCRMLVRWSLPMESKVGRFLASPLSLPVFAAWTALTLWPYPRFKLDWPWRAGAAAPQSA